MEVNISQPQIFSLQQDNSSEPMDIDADHIVQPKVCTIDQDKTCPTFQSNVNDLVFMDVQGFKAMNGKFICKEICGIFGDQVFHSFVKSPYNFNQLKGDYFKRNAEYMTKRIHKIKFDYGYVHKTEIVQALHGLLMDKKIVVLNDQKARMITYWFRKYASFDCVIFENMGHDVSLRSQQPYAVCDYHIEVFGWEEGHCALTIATKMKDITERNAANLKK